MALSKESAKKFEKWMRSVAETIGPEQRVMVVVRGLVERADGTTVEITTDAATFRADWVLNKSGLGSVGKRYVGGNTVEITVGLEGQPTDMMVFRD